MILLHAWNIDEVRRLLSCEVDFPVSSATVFTICLKVSHSPRPRLLKKFLELHNHSPPTLSLLTLSLPSFPSPPFSFFHHFPTPSPFPLPLPGAHCLIQPKGLGECCDSCKLPQRVRADPATKQFVAHFDLKSLLLNSNFEQFMMCVSTKINNFSSYSLLWTLAIQFLQRSRPLDCRRINAYNSVTELRRLRLITFGFTSDFARRNSTKHYITTRTQFCKWVNQTCTSVLRSLHRPVAKHFCAFWGKK